MENLARSAAVEPFSFDRAALIKFLAARAHWSNETRRARLQTFRVFWEWAIKEGRTSINPVTGLPRVPMARPNPSPVPYRVYLSTLLLVDRRTRLILRLAGEMGLRRGEIAIIAPELDLFSNEEGWWLTVHGKGGKIRIAPVPEALVHEVTDFAGSNHWLFPGNRDGHLSPRYVSVLANAALEGNWTIHKLRHLFAKRTYQISRDIYAVQALLGHASPVTTQQYVPVEDCYLGEIVNTVSAKSFNIELDDKFRTRAQSVITIDFNTITPTEAMLLVLRLSERAVGADYGYPVPTRLQVYRRAS
ncbi:integrase [Leucobacter chromiireducens subsp. solipictus]|uniref:Integrase n=2 Tax=Leucobacter TaxID=55968 RepID=A0ABS1SDA2_9MICO|nr:integrase [Leucobacter chromiireducens subsp. solipictus]